MKKSKGLRAAAVIGVLLFAAVTVWFLISLNNADTAARENRTTAVYNNIMNGSVLCYSIEGEYPPDMDYLRENYGITYDRDRYIVDYSYFGANVRPTVRVIEK